jgi:hypothetical protein
MTDDGYDWRGVGAQPNNNPALSWERTFGQRKAHVAKAWEENESTYDKKMRIERMVYYSAIHEVKEL